MGIVAEGLTQFPELTLSYQALLETWDNEAPGTYTTFQEVFRPHFAMAVEQNDQSLIIRYGRFFEDVFESADTEAENVIWLKIFKWLLADESRVLASWGYLGPETKVALQDAASRWDLEDRLPLTAFGLKARLKSLLRIT